MARQNWAVTNSYNTTTSSAAYVVIGIIILLISGIMIVGAVNNYSRIKKTLSEGINISATCTRT